MANEYGHLKLVLVGMLEADTYVRTTAQLLYNLPNAEPEYKELYGYLHTIGVPNEAKDGLAGILEQIFGGGAPVAAGASAGDGGIDTDYDQDNCDYGALIEAANQIDTETAVTVLRKARARS